jgi:hypothetical protein
MYRNANNQISSKLAPLVSAQHRHAPWYSRRTTAAPPPLHTLAGLDPEIGLP